MVKCTGPLPEEWYAMTDPKPYEDGMCVLVIQVRVGRLLIRIYATAAAAQVKTADEYWATLFPNDKELVSLLRSMMQFRPRERKKAEELADTAWFEEIRARDVERKMRTAEAA